MAEEEKKYTPGTRGRIKGGVINTLKAVGNAFGGRFHFSRTADLELVPRKKLRDAIDLLNLRIKELINVETQYGLVEKTLGPQIEDIYKEIGFYTDSNIIDKERKFLNKGTAMEGSTDPEMPPIDKKKETIYIDGKDHDFLLPPERDLKFPDGYIEKVSYFGYNQKKTWQDRYAKFIEKVCQDKVDKINSSKYTPEQKSNMVDFVNKIVKKSYLTVLPQLFAGLPGEGVEGIPENISAKEKLMESFLYKSKEHFEKKLKSLRAEIYKNMTDKVRYKHTYKVVDLDKIRDKKRLWEADGDSELEKKRKREVWEEEKKKWVDENGMPLEVAITGYTFKPGYGKAPRGCKEGEVLLDIFEGKTIVRSVPKAYIKDLPLIEVVNYVHCEWDEYRDTLRDGRYHPDSLTVMDYIMAANPAIGDEWKTRLKPLSIGPGYRKYRMKLADGRVITHQREASNLNPAFDLRAFKREGGRYWQYVGKKKYYEHADDACTDEQHDPHISTRGLSMFIIETICRQGKNIDEIHEELVKVGEKTGGFDYGPRKFGAAFCKDPFNIDLSSATESVMESPIITGPPSES